MFQSAINSSDEEMENEDSCNSLPYMDDTLTDDETNPHQYNLKIIENYHNQNRNIEISNRYPKEAIKSLSPIAPLADETEFNDFSDEDACKHTRKESGMKLIIKGWNSSISIQGLDNKSSITFKRRCEKTHKKLEKNEEGKSKAIVDEKSVEKTRKGRWKMLTRSIMLTKSARFERRGMDERYPKYVLLKNEEEEVTKEKENYPKMFIFNEKSSKQKKSGENKTEFSFKKSFKNKTEPIAPLDEILTEGKVEKSREGVIKQKKPLTQRNLYKKKITSERRKSISGERKAGMPTQPESLSRCQFSHGQVCSEIQGIFEDTLKLLPQVQPEENHQQTTKRVEYLSSIPPQFSQFPCHDPYCCASPLGQPPKYTPVYPPHKPHVYKTPNMETKANKNEEIGVEEQTDVEVDLENLPFGMLSTFFPRVVIMNTIRSNSLRGGEEEIISATNGAEFQNYHRPPESDEKKEERKETETKTVECLEVPKQDLTLKIRMIQDVIKPEMEIKEIFMSEVGLKEFPSLDDDQKTKSQGSEATEYLQYSEFDSPENESVERLNSPSPAQFDGKEKKEKTLPTVDKFKIEDVDENSENLSLTKIGYKMYDNLTKLSLNREKEMTKKAEVSGCGCNGNGTKKSPYNITLESNNRVVKVTVPENELNFQIVNSQGGGDIQIGVMSGGKGKEDDKKIVRREELWHCDDGGRTLVLQNEKSRYFDTNEKGVQNFKVSLANNREVVLSIEMNDKEKKQEQIKEKTTKEMKVGTDDFDIAGGDFVCTFGENYKNLSPRVAELLKHLHKKLETDQKERKFLDEKINQKLIDQKFQGGILPGVFLVKHISPRTPPCKKPAEVSSFRKQKKTTESHERQGGQLREYYCEECLATMRIFEDENPSVKSMVDKFETIIQLESY